MDNQFLRTQMLLGGDAMNQLHRSHVAVFGLGGVGSYAVEALVRSAVGELTLIDDDTVSPTNLNRQLEALHSTVGQNKTDALAARCRDINPDVRLHLICARYDAAHREDFFTARYDYILDAIDTVSSKLDLIQTAQARGIPILSAMGTGNKLDASQLCITDISKTRNCSLARVMRKELRDRGVKHLRVIYSPELPAKPEALEAPPPGRRSVPASLVWVPGCAGLMMAGDVILTLARMQKRERRRQPMILTGTIVNSAAIVAGSIAGLLLGKFIPERFSDAMEKGAALCVLYIGVDGMLAGENTLVAILSISIGAILGELLQLDEHMHQLGDWVERKFGGKGSKTSLSDGFVTASLLFCVGAMAIMGALDSGLTGDHSTLYAKALLDGIISVVYASTLGIGVALSAIPIFLYQGAIALGASFLAPYLTEAVILEMKCVGSILILGLSLNMLGLTKIKVMNYVPAVFLPILLCRFL